MMNLNDMINKYSMEINDTIAPIEFDIRVNEAIMRMRSGVKYTIAPTRKMPLQILQYGLSTIAVLLILGLMVYLFPYKKAPIGTSPENSSSTTSPVPSTTKTTIDPDEQIAIDFIKSQGYIITAVNGKYSQFILEKSQLDQGYIMMEFWSVLETLLNEYIGKEIKIYSFTVTNHPLENIYKTSNGINISIMISNGKVIGGNSSPNMDEPLYGGSDSLDGKTLEEYTGMSFADWKVYWHNLYNK